METTIVIKDGVYQLVLTPESEHEKAVLKLMKDKSKLTIYEGNYQEVSRCSGGWYREYYEGNNCLSLILLLEAAPPASEEFKEGE